MKPVERATASAIHVAQACAALPLCFQPTSGSSEWLWHLMLYVNQTLASQQHVSAALVGLRLQAPVCVGQVGWLWLPLHPLPSCVCDDRLAHCIRLNNGLHMAFRLHSPGTWFSPRNLLWGGRCRDEQGWPRILHSLQLPCTSFPELFSSGVKLVFHKN